MTPRPGPQLASLLFATLLLTLPIPARAETQRLDLLDAARNKTLTVYVTWPTTLPADGKLPIVLVSHGAGSTGKVLGPLCTALANHGYICLAPTHDDARAAHPSSRPATRPADRLLGSQDIWESRAKDFTFLLDSTTEIEKQIPALSGKFDESKTAIVGHSLGAFTALLLAGATPTWEATPPPLRDARITAIVLLSPPSPGQQGLTAASFEPLALPTLVVSGSSDHPTQTPTPGTEENARTQAYSLLPDGDKYLLDLEGANRFSYIGGLLGNAPAQQKFANATNQLTATFLDAYLKSDAAQKDLLISGSAVAPYREFATLESR